MFLVKIQLPKQISTEQKIHGYAFDLLNELRSAQFRCRAIDISKRNLSMEISFPFS